MPVRTLRALFSLSCPKLGWVRTLKPFFRFLCPKLGPVRTLTTLFPLLLSEVAPRLSKGGPIQAHFNASKQGLAILQSPCKNSVSRAYSSPVLSSSAVVSLPSSFSGVPASCSSPLLISSSCLGGRMEAITASSSLFIS